MKHPTFQKHIITKYLCDQASELEIDQLSIWLKDKQNQNIFKNYLKIEILFKLKYKSFNSEKAFSNFINEINKEKKSNSLNLLYSMKWIKYAAIFIGVVLMTTYLVNKNKSNNIPLNNDVVTLEVHNSHNTVKTFQIEKLKVVKNNGVNLGKIKNAVLVYKIDKNSKHKDSSLNILKVPYGKRFEVKLADGTKVFLNSGSVLKYPSNFKGNSQREVTLQGEAFFEVAKNPNIPFIVKTIDIETKVFGTKFNISTYAKGYGTTEVVLVKGIIGVKLRENRENSENKKDYVLMKPSQMASKIKGVDKISIKNVNIYNYISWRNDILKFENERVENILKVLERHFNVEIQNNYSEFNNQRFTGTFKVKNIEEILNIMKVHTDFLYQKGENKIIINMKPKNINAYEKNN